MLLLVAGVIPAFLGESHFAFLGYAKNFRQTPIRRQLDYLRVLGGSKEAAKELKLFGLKDFLTARFTHLSDQIYDEDVGLARRKLIAGSHAFPDRYRRILRCLRLRDLANRRWSTHHRHTHVPDCGAFMQASSNIQQIFSTVSSIADQALFLTDLVAFFEMQPTIRSKPNALPAPQAHPRWLRVPQRLFPVSRGIAQRSSTEFNFHLHPGERVALIGENGQGKTTIVKLLTRLYDPTEGKILLDGVDLREYDLEDLYREIGVIFQDFMRYEMTARENIAVGKIEEIDNLPLLRSVSAQEHGGRGHRPPRQRL